VLPARALDQEDVAVPLEAEEVPNSKAELAAIRDRLMTHHLNNLRCELCAKAKIQIRQERKHFSTVDVDPLSRRVRGPLHRRSFYQA
jgi:hypothetical protein